VNPAEEECFRIGNCNDLDRIEKLNYDGYDDVICDANVKDGIGKRKNGKLPNQSSTSFSPTYNLLLCDRSMIVR